MNTILPRLCIYASFVTFDPRLRSRGRESRGVIRAGGAARVSAS